MHSNSISKLLNLTEVIVKKVEHKNSVVDISIETKPSSQTCPACGQQTSKIHDYRTQKVKHTSIGHKSIVLTLRKRRYSCSCGKRFYEHYYFLSRYMRCTKDLMKHICHELRKQVSFASVAKDAVVSTKTAIRYFDYISYPKPSKLPEVLCIDEFRGNAGSEKFQCILVDGKKNKILDILPDRKWDHLIKYFATFTRKERSRVRFFVSDMWRPYRDLAKRYFPNAEIITDKYHFIRQVTWAIESVRKELQKTMPADLRKYYKHSRSLILKRESKVKEEKRPELELMLTYNDQLRHAHWLKERFLDVCEQPKYSIQRKDFWDWIKFAEKSGIPKFEKCAETFRNWKIEILNALKYGYTNGSTEGFNNKIKVLKRISYGVQDFERFRNRILHCN
ncbi:MAG TPA: ISL3 family transposase [Candidatus Dorea intestinavium]|nr:ISL3 family transposase [Candidatus Dorea intestinavium]